MVVSTHIALDQEGSLMGLYIQFDNIVGNKTIPQHYMFLYIEARGGRETGPVKTEYPTVKEPLEFL